MSEHEKVAIVTGAGSGIGKTTALALAREGYAVAVAGRRVEPLEGTVAEVEQLGGNALAVSTDVGDPASVKALFANTVETYGRIDLLFNNAGVLVDGVRDELAYAVHRFAHYRGDLLTGCGG